MEKKQSLVFIFDMDGVVVDNIPFHRRAWREFFKRHRKNFIQEMRNKKFSDYFFDNHINGRRGEEIMRRLFDQSVTKEQTMRWDAERETWYRKAYAPHITPLSGLIAFLETTHRAKIPMALATSAPPDNVRFVLRKTKLRRYFTYIVDAAGIKHGKPHPDMFLKAARKLKTPPKRCVVFEDAILGVKAGRRAGMKVVAIMTSYTKKQLDSADLFVRDFTDPILKTLFPVTLRMQIKQRIK